MAKWVKSITLAILLGILLLGLYILFPNKNKVVQIKELNYATLFNDQNGVQLKSAAKLGIKQPLKNRDAADDVKDSLVHIKSNSHYNIAKLTHSIPYLTEGAAELLDMNGKTLRVSPHTETGKGNKPDNGYFMEFAYDSNIWEDPAYNKA